MEKQQQRVKFSTLETYDGILEKNSEKYAGEPTLEKQKQLIEALSAKESSEVNWKGRFHELNTIELGEGIDETGFVFNSELSTSLPLRDEMNYRKVASMYAHIHRIGWCNDTIESEKNYGRERSSPESVAEAKHKKGIMVEHLRQEVSGYEDRDIKKMLEHFKTMTSVLEKESLKRAQMKQIDDDMQL